LYKKGGFKMDKNTEIVRDYYNAEVLGEWDRIVNRPEFLLTCRMLDRYIKPGDKVLDIGGGPGRYTMHLAAKGCDVTLFDLSPENVKFALGQAKEQGQGLSIKAFDGDARDVDKIINEKFDHVLLMGPLYHLLERAEGIKAINAALNVLKPGGILYASFISMMGGIIYYMKHAPEAIAFNIPSEVEFIENFIARKSYAGDAFTKATFIELSEVLPLMEQFPLDKLHLFCQEGVMSPCEDKLMSQPQEIIDAWLDLCESIWDREELLSWGEHIMYVGRKR